MSEKSGNILFKKFDIISCIKKDTGSGVYIANHVYLGKKIFLKTLNTEIISDKAILGRFQREARILAQLDHINIIKVLDFGTYEQYFYISFEYFKSRNLRELTQQKSLNDQEKLVIFKQILSGLYYAHRQEIIHRDLKPENILINDLLKVKIADFGLALMKNDTTITKSAIVGTPAYMAPEQIRGEELTQQSDIFSFGTILFELYTGKNPFLGKDITTTVNNILNFTRESIVSGLEHIHEPIKNVILDMLQKDRIKRLASLEIIIPKIEISEDESLISSTKTPSIRKVNRLKWIVFPTLVISLSTIMYWFLMTKNNSEQIISEQNHKISSDTLKYNLNNHDTIKNKIISDNIIETTIQENDKAIETLPKTNLNITGKLFVHCLPWANVIIDSQKVDITPLEDTIIVSTGIHQLLLKHPDYPPFIKILDIKASETTFISVDLDTLFGYLACDVYPWGEVYIDNQHIERTPLLNAIVLNPGKYLLSVDNPHYAKVDEFIHIIRGDTFYYKLNFESIVKP